MSIGGLKVITEDYFPYEGEDHEYPDTIDTRTTVEAPVVVNDEGATVHRQVVFRHSLSPASAETVEGLLGALDEARAERFIWKLENDKGDSKEVQLATGTDGFTGEITRERGDGYDGPQESPYTGMSWNDVQQEFSWVFDGPESPRDSLDSRMSELRNDSMMTSEQVDTLFGPDEIPVFKPVPLTQEEAAERMRQDQLDAVKEMQAEAERDRREEAEMRADQE